MMDNKEKAKKMFFDYACSTERIDHDGMLHVYRSFGYISKSEEEEWRREFISLWTDKLSVDDLTALRELRNAWASEALAEIIAIAPKGDSYTTFEYAKVIWDLADGNTKQQTRKLAIELLKTLLLKPITLSDENKEGIENSIARRGGISTAEEYITEEVKYLIDFWSKLC